MSTKQSIKQVAKGIVLAAPVGPGAGIENPALGSYLRGLAAPGGGGGSTYFSRLISTTITFVLIAGAVGSLFYLLLGAFEYITSGGDKQALQNAQGKIRNALIGLVLMFSSFAIIQVMETFLNINIMTIDIDQLLIR